MFETAAKSINGVTLLVVKRAWGRNKVSNEVFIPIAKLDAGDGLGGCMQAVEKCLALGVGETVNLGPGP